MVVLQVARIIANFCLFLDLTDDETLDPDAAVQMLELLGKNLQELDKPFLKELIDAFAVIAPEYAGETEASVRSIPDNFYLEDVVYADDPVKLAELEARRDAEEF